MQILLSAAAVWPTSATPFVFHFAMLSYGANRLSQTVATSNSRRKDDTAVVHKVVGRQRENHPRIRNSRNGKINRNVGF